MNARSALSNGLMRLLKETAYVGGASILVLIVYRVVIPRVSSSDANPAKRAALATLDDRSVLSLGRHVNVRNVNFQDGRYWFFLFTSGDCVFCRNSASFHKLLLVEAERYSVPLFVATKKGDEVPGYLLPGGVASPKLLSWLDFDARAARTPTLVLVDSGGTVRRIWVGQLAAAAQNEVLELIRGPSHVAVLVRRLQTGEPMLGPDDLRKPTMTKPVMIVSISERSEFKSARNAVGLNYKNLPIDELAVRAPFELNRARLTVVDCTTESDQSCSLALEILAALGFRAAALDRGPDIVQK